MKSASRFATLAKIASGATATVYVGAPVRGSKGTLVALKRPHPHVLEDERQRETLLREARVASALHHPNLVLVREVEVEGQELQLVMDYVEGAAFGTLIAAEARAGGRVPPAVAVRIALDACAGLEAVHEQRDADGRLLGLVHRDISPQNILVGVDGVARLTDFGLAKAVYEGAPSTTQGTLKGKLGYMAPEYVSRGRLDRLVDVFAMGVVIWEALAGQRLFRGENEIQTLDRVLRETPPELAGIAPELAAFDPLIAWAVAKDPSTRAPSARALADALEKAALTLGPLATAAEVGAYVTRLMGSELEERRGRVRDAVRERSRRGVLSRAAVGLLLSAPVIAVAVVMAATGRTARPAAKDDASAMAADPGAPPAGAVDASADPSASASTVEFGAEDGAPASVPSPPPSHPASPVPRGHPLPPATHGLPPNPYVHHAPTR